MIVRTPFNINKIDWTLDDHIHYDVPAILDFVKEEAGAAKVIWIGHSMGGMAMYGYLMTNARSNDIDKFVPIASTIMIPNRPEPDSVLARIASQKPVMHASLLVNTTVASQMRNLTLGTLKLPWERLFFNRDNMDKMTAIKMFRVAIDDTSPGVIEQYTNMIKNGHLESSDKGFNYTHNIQRVGVPILVVAGAGDRMSSLDNFNYVLENVSSRKKEGVIFSKENGFSADYGHCDLILGRNAPEEVYAYIYDWLEKN